MAPRKIIDMLAEIGVPGDLLDVVVADWCIRADLGLSSAETFELQLLLEKVGCVGFSLWDSRDYSLEQLEKLIASCPEQREHSDSYVGSGAGIRYRAGDPIATSIVPLNQRLLTAMKDNEDKVALIEGVENGKVISYRELMLQVECTVNRLNNHGVRKGDRIAFQLPNISEAVVLMIAALMMGAIPVPILPAYRERELRHILKVTQPKVIALARGTRRFSPISVVMKILAEESVDIKTLLVSGFCVSDKSDEILNLEDFCSNNTNGRWTAPDVAEMQADETAMMLLSSGTTGLPKAIARRNAGYSYMIAEACKVFELSHTSIYLAVLPISHGFVINCPGILGVLCCGGTVVLATEASADVSMRLIEAHGVTHATLVPALLIHWCARADGYDIGTLTHVQVGGARLQADAAEAAESRLGIRIQQCYGMSEGLLCFTRPTDPDGIRFNSQGSPLSAEDEILIVDDHGRELPCGKSGELITRGPYTINRYYNDPLALHASFTADGYYRTGDIAHVDSDGNVYIDGRITNSINRGGEKFCPEEIEELIRSNAKLIDAACVGIADERFGEVACIFVILKENEKISLADARQYLEALGIASFKLPEKLLIVSEIPRKGIGKIDRLALKSWASDLVK